MTERLSITINKDSLDSAELQLALTKMFAYIDAVSTEVAPSEKARSWEVVSLSKNSPVKIDLRPRFRSGAKAGLEAVKSIQAVKESPDLPSGRTPETMRHLATLVAMGVSIQFGAEAATLDSHFERHLDQIQEQCSAVELEYEEIEATRLKPEYAELIGTLKDIVTSVKNGYIHVMDSASGKKVKCLFTQGQLTHELIEELREDFFGRVAIEGMAEFDQDGQITEMKIDEIRGIPAIKTTDSLSVLRATFEDGAVIPNEW